MKYHIDRLHGHKPKNNQITLTSYQFKAFNFWWPVIIFFGIARRYKKSPSILPGHPDQR